MSALIRPLQTRVADARMDIAASPLTAELLSFELAGPPADAPEIEIEVREQVLRAALNDALACHVAETCEHVADAHCAPFAVLARGEALCMFCIYEAEPWAGPVGSPCTLCGGDGRLTSTMTRISTAPHALTYVAHVCATCSSWWPRHAPESAPPPAQHADVRYLRSGPPSRPGEV